MWASLMEAMGYPVGYRKLVTVNFNGVSYDAIFEESTEKEFLERWSFREAPIVEMDERQIWAYGSWDKDEINCLRTLNVKNCDIWPERAQMS